MFMLCALASMMLLTPAETAGVERPIDDFDWYRTDAELSRIWYRPPHGGGAAQTLDPTVKATGKQSLKFAYSLSREEGKQYAAICRVSRWDLGGTTAVRFWFKPDGSGRKLMFQLNIANAKGENIHDLWDFEYVPKKGDTSARLVTVPYSKLVHNVKYADSKDTSPVFKPEAVIEVALYIGSRKDEPGTGVYHFDDFVAVALNTK